jgi:hypothetical protein
MRYYKGQHFSVQNNLDEIRTFQNTINSINKFQSLVTSMVEVHRQKPCVTSHIQRNAFVTQFKNFISCFSTRTPDEIIIRMPRRCGKATTFNNYGKKIKKWLKASHIRSTLVNIQFRTFYIH